jgi:hypothetical protein
MAMSEAEWLACYDTYQLLQEMVGRASDRKFRLFGCACCRRIWHLMPDERWKHAVQVVERWADGLASEADLVSARRDMARCPREVGGLSGIYESEDARVYAHSAVSALVVEVPQWRPHDGSRPNAACQAGGACASSAAHALRLSDIELGTQEERFQLRLLKDIFANPFRPSILDRAWLAWNNGTIAKLAATIYDERRFELMPILADALEDAGCHDSEMLGHCRGMPHVRGCWLIDLILGKE